MASLDAGRRGDRARPLLGLLPGHGARQRGHPRRCPLRRGHRIQTHTGGPGRRHYRAAPNGSSSTRRPTPPAPSTPATNSRALADVLAGLPHVYVLTDEIYDQIYFGAGKLTSLVEVAPELKDRILAVNGVSKAYAMTGWRLGYAAGPAPLIAAINKLQSQISSCPSSVSQAAAAAALTGDQSFVRESLEVYRSRRDTAVAALNAVDGLSCTTPEGAFYAYVNCCGRHRQDDAGGTGHRQRPGLHPLPAGCRLRGRHPGLRLRPGPVLPHLLRHQPGRHRGIHRCHRQGRPGPQLIQTHRRKTP